MMKSRTKKLKLSALSWVFLIPVLSFAQQSLSGTITDADTGEPLLGVTVLVQGTNKGTVSDFDGNYTINNLNPGDYVVEVSYTGYSKLSQNVSIGNSDAELYFQMTFSASELDEIVVTGTGAPVAKKQEQMNAEHASWLQEYHNLNLDSELFNSISKKIIEAASKGLSGVTIHATHTCFVNIGVGDVISILRKNGFTVKHTNGSDYSRQGKNWNLIGNWETKKNGFVWVTAINISW